MSKPTPNSAVPRLAYNTAGTAQALGLSIATIRRAANHGLIRRNKVGRIDSFPATEVERVAAEGLPAIPHEYVRKTTGPTKQGRPRGSAKAKPAAKPVPPRRARKAERPSA